MSKIKLAVLDGDGIGPEVVRQAVKVLEAIGRCYGHEFSYAHAAVGAAAIDQTGNPLPRRYAANCRASDAVLFGAIGHPRYDNDPGAKVRPEQGLLRLRKELGLYANLRPVTSYDKLLHLSPLREDRIRGVDLLIVRELTGGIYFGEKGRTADGDTAFDTCTYSRHEIERIARLGFVTAAGRRKKLTLVDKANVMETSRLWREIVRETAADYPEIEVDYMFVDNAAMQVIQNPAQFDVIITSNMFGDILSDAASVLTGSLGLLPSSSIGSRVGLFEPIHGSYPQAVGRGIANPLATILSAAMLLDHLGHAVEAASVRGAVTDVLLSGRGTPDLHPATVVTTEEVGDAVSERISSNS